jgi:hypothetical protein
MSRRFFAQFRMLAATLALMALLSCSGAAAWERAQIADALRAAPPTVTHQAKLYGWQPFGQLVLVRDGPGPYTCVASGSASRRFAKPPLPFPDPFCADPHAWAFIQAYWTEEDPGPTEAITSLPRAPGLVWMLEARQGITTHVAAGIDQQALVQTTLTRAAQGAHHAAADTISLTPQLMILPLPLDPARGIISPPALHYELHHGDVPTIDPTHHTLLIHGLVRRPLTLTLYDLMRFPSVNRISFLECSGNGFREWRQPTGKDVQQTHARCSIISAETSPLSSRGRSRPTRSMR